MRKDYLQALANLASSRAFPSSQKIDIPVVADQRWNVYVAPADGFVYVEGSTAKGELNAAVAELSSVLGSYAFSTHGTARASLPVQKGQQVDIAARGENGVYAYFIPAKAST